MEIIEAFCAEHNVSFDEVLYDWPSSKFEALYQAFLKRQVADELKQRRTAEVAALWGNPNLDNPEDKNARMNFMQSVEANFTNAIEALYANQLEPAGDYQEIDESDPFWAAAKQGKEKLGLPDPTLDMDIDQDG